MDWGQTGARRVPVPSDLRVRQEQAEDDVFRTRLHGRNGAMNPKDRMEAGGGSVLSGLLNQKKQQSGSDNYIRTKKDDAMLRAGKVPAGWNKGEDGKVRPMVQ